MTEHWIIMMYAFFHTLTPGHSKSLILALGLSGRPRRAVLDYSVGFALAHAIVMVFAIALGFAFKGILAAAAGESEIIMNLSIGVLAAAGAYFLWEAWKMKKRTASEEKAPAGILDRRPMMAGMIMGLIPCPEMIGLGLVVPSMATGATRIAMALLLVWSTVCLTIIGLGALVSFLPVRQSALRFRVPDWGPPLASALLCAAVILYRIKTA